MSLQESPRRWWALLSLVPAVLAVSLDATVLSVALPTLGTELHASTGQLQWFVIAYSLAFAAAMIPAGMLGDRWGRKRLLLGALVVFGAGSLGCAVSGDATWFVVSRVVLGVGAAAILPMALAAAPTLFREEERTRAVGVLMSVTMLGFPIGPLLGGWLLSHTWWGWVFLINLPVVAIALASVGTLMPEARGALRGRIDVIGILLSAASLSALSYGVISAGRLGWDDAGCLALVAGGILLVLVFVWWERRVAAPLVDLSLFRSRTFTGGAALATVVSFVMMGLLFALPLQAQTVAGLDAEGSGLRLLPLIGGLLLTALPSGLLAQRVGTGPVIAAGLAVLAAGLAWGATAGVDDGGWFSAAWIALCGAGIGLSLPPSMDAALGTLSTDAAGTGSAVLQAMRMVGSSFGAAILGAVLNSGYRSALPAGDASLVGLPGSVVDSVRDSIVAAVRVAHGSGSEALLRAARSAFMNGFDLMLLVAAALAALAAVVAVRLMAGQAGPTQVDEAGSPHELHPTG
jgi:DHA2 family multidrug resistance protein-like MFS transporter